MSYFSHMLASLAIVTAVAFAPRAVFAAAYVCQEPLTGLGDDRVEMQAKRLALENWVAMARQHSAGHAHWGIAYNRQICCARIKNGLYRCKAVGRPCIVKNKVGGEFKPFPRGAAAAASDAPCVIDE